MSAIKINGQRAYKRVRDGEDVEIPSRRITIFKLEVRRIDRPADTGAIDVDIDVTCSSGTYIRAIARDLGTALGVGGHLTALRRTAVGGLTLAESSTLAELEEKAPDVIGLPMAAAAGRAFPRREASEEESRVLSHGGPLAPVGIEGPYAVFDPAGVLLAIVSEREGKAKPEIVLQPA